MPPARPSGTDIGLNEIPRWSETLLSRSLYSETSSVWHIDPDLWKVGGDIRLPVKGASLPWICRNPSGPVLVVFPHRRGLSDFSNDWHSLFGQHPYELTEIPLERDSVADTALYIRRGMDIGEWGGAGGIMLATPGALMAHVKQSSSWRKIIKGDEIPRDSFISWLFGQGYVSSDNVWSPGQYVLRGSIIDIFDPAYHYPLRLEFFDEMLEQIRIFNPHTQKSIGSVDDIDLHGVRSGVIQFPIELLPPSLHVVLCDPGKIEDQAENYFWLWESLSGGRQDLQIKSWKEVYEGLRKHPLIRISQKEIVNPAMGKQMEIYPCPYFKGHMDAFRAQCSTWTEGGKKILLFSTNERYLGLAEKIGVDTFRNFLSRGFVDNRTGTVIVSDTELAGLTPSPSGEDRSPIPFDWGRRLSSGDWVVHEDYGVALFSGLETVDMDNLPTDMFVLRFADDKRLLMPVTQFSKLSKLSVLPGTEIVPDSLGGTRWKKQVREDRERAKKEAAKLLKLYAEREIIKGTAFPSDGEYLKELERSFPFAETADQLRAVEAVKADMEKTVPMDRLIVGDVGYGKTEVAIRAAMKAVESGRQVAVLVPTTILAQQHFNTFVTRMSGFPVKIEVLSRFVKPAQQRRIKEEIKLGKVDVIIGTQKLLQKDIAFRSLGLLIIDEEHRFGVLHKERLKDAYPSVDVLTLSATPIPRTLSMSLKGLKGISVISTPPENRMPVMTFVGPWRKDVVEKAVSRELSRGGQIFFVYNRVSDIDSKAALLRSIFPKASIAVAHGQMKEKELEKNMLSFYGGETDILVCTTIVESGLDVGRANTMIVNEANELGLAQLYQLRGRIGRRGETGYAFFLYDEDKSLSHEASERLEAIANLSSGGSGYSLSMQDLGIRGAGEFVGTMQHGRSTRMGLDYYYDMLEKEINRLRGIRFSEPAVTLEMSVTIPSSYIPQEGVRISLYRRLFQISGLEELREVEKEMIDRFGPVPGSVRYLLDLCMVRKAGAQSGIISISSGPSSTEIRYLPDSPKLRGMSAPGWIFKNDCAVGPGGSRGMRDLAFLLGNRPVAVDGSRKK